MWPGVHYVYAVHPLFKCLSLKLLFQSIGSERNQKPLNHFTRRLIASEKKGKITFNWISPAFTGHFVQQYSLCSLCLGDKAHYIIVVHCVLTVGPLPDCWEWISWAHCPYSKARLFKVKRPDLITQRTYVDYRFLYSIALHIINFFGIQNSCHTEI